MNALIEYCKSELICDVDMKNFFKNSVTSRHLPYPIQNLIYFCILLKRIPYDCNIKNYDLCAILQWIVIKLSYDYDAQMSLSNYLQEYNVDDIISKEMYILEVMNYNVFVSRSEYESLHSVFKIPKYISNLNSNKFIIQHKHTTQNVKNINQPRNFTISTAYTIPMRKRVQC